MATVKLATLAIRTIAKPISAKLKQQAREHPAFRHICVRLAQSMYRTEMRWGTTLLGQTPKAVKPLSEAKAIDNGANFIAESFLFAVAASLIMAETWRSSHKESKRREGVADQLEDLSTKVGQLEESLTSVQTALEERMREERGRSDELARILENIVNIGLRGGWVAFQDTPLRIPHIEVRHSNESEMDTDMVIDISHRTLQPPESTQEGNEEEREQER
ncbi:OPA3-domain-containing protein [Hysterangium stoloniferum]|nr:OPA3-domain-containing protein [Hysterangium stoloniferum]